MNKPLTYISLFSSAGVGCFGFKQNGFECIATNEILTKRLKIQAFNNKCKYDTGYLDGDISTKEIKNTFLVYIHAGHTQLLCLYCTIMRYDRNIVQDKRLKVWSSKIRV